MEHGVSISPEQENQGAGIGDDPQTHKEGDANLGADQNGGRYGH